MADEITNKVRAVRVQEVEVNGVAGWLYSDGSVRGESGHMLAPLPGGADKITPANARNLNLRRFELARAEFAAGLAEGLGVNSNIPLTAWRAVAKKAGDLLKKTESVRGFSDLARFAGESGGFIPLARGRESDDSQQQQNDSAVFVIFAQFISKLQADPSPDNKVINDITFK